MALGFLVAAWFAEPGWQTGTGVSSIAADEPRQAQSPVAPPRGGGADQITGEQQTTSEPDDAPRIECFPRPSKIEARILESLDKPTTVDFAEARFDTCLSYLRNYHKFSLWIDRRTITDEGIALDQPITLKMAGVSLRGILKLILEPPGLTYVIDDDAMKITTSQADSERLMTRIYPVRDLYQGRGIVGDESSDDKAASRRGMTAHRGDLETAFLKTIDPDSWDERQGPGSITYVSKSASLVIRQTPPVHDKILKLLRDLREAKRVGQGGRDPKLSGKISWRFRGPQRAEAFSLVGIMDIDGEGTGDREKLLEMIAASGGRVDNEIDEQGVLRVAGRIEEGPTITEHTKLIVVGKIPDPANLSDPDAIAISLKIAGFYAELEKHARTRGVRVVGVDEFLRYIGYEPSTGKPLSR